MAKKLTDLLPSSVATLASVDNMKDRKSWTWYPITHNGVVGAQFPSYVDCDENYGRERWVVPTGVTKARFEIWSGGGGGAAAYCCMLGVNGGSGAWAYKDVNVTPGDVYTVCAECLCQQNCCNNGSGMGGFGCVDPAGHCMFMKGLKGSKAYITGVGLTNFCATGGAPGITTASWWMNQASFTNMMTNSCQPGPGRVLAGEELICANSTCTRNMCLTYRDMLWPYTVNKGTDIDDSDASPFNNACYYGADCGFRGQYSYFRFGCCGHMCVGGDAFACAYKHTYVYPPGLWTHPNRSICGGHIEQIIMGSCHCLNTPHSTGEMCKWKAIMDYGQNSFNRLQGSGGMSAWTSAGTCCCGAMGGAPMFRITYC